MAVTYVVQTKLNPGVSYEVDQAEYDLLLEQNLLLNAPIQPQAPGVFDNAVRALVDDVNTQTRTGLDARFVVGTGLRQTKALDQGAYDAEPVKASTTLYVIMPA